MKGVNTNSMKQFVLFLIVVVFVIFAGITFASEDSQEERVLSCIRRNVAACNNEDMQLLKVTQDLTLRDEMEIERVWRMYDCEVMLVGVDVIRVGAWTAEVRTKISTRKLRGPAFSDNVITAVHTLEQHFGSWKITNTKVERVEPYRVFFRSINNYF